MNKHIRPVVYIVSDSIGETAELVVKAAASQFSTEINLKRFPFVEDIEALSEIIIQAKQQQAMIGYTIVVPQLKEFLIKRANQEGIPIIDMIGPMLRKMEELFEEKPRNEPGLVHKLDEDYFRKVEAIEFAVQYDDGKDPRGILRADIILLGVSRTSKTPLSQYLAMKRLKVANVPIVPEVKPPKELFQVSKEKCYGLRISPEKLNGIRKERLKSLGLDDHAQYANLERIKTELAYFDGIVTQIGCQVIDVSNKAVEETTNYILNVYKRRKI